jgi:hypothetical protein
MKRLKKPVNPRKERVEVISWGKGQLDTASTFFGSTDTPSEETQNPRKDVDRWAKVHLEILHLRLAASKAERTCEIWSRCSASERE